MNTTVAATRKRTSNLLIIATGVAFVFLIGAPWLALNNPTWAGLLMFPPLLALLFFGFPVAFSLMGIALFFGFMRFGEAAIGLFVAKVDDDTLVNLPRLVGELRALSAAPGARWPERAHFGVHLYRLWDWAKALGLYGHS